METTSVIACFFTFCPILWYKMISNSTHFFVLSRTMVRHRQPRLMRHLPRYKLHQEVFFLSLLILSISSMILILSSFGIEVKIFVVLASGKFIRCRARRRIAAFVLISIIQLRTLKQRVAVLPLHRQHHPREKQLIKRKVYR